MRRPPLGELLIQAKVVTAEQLAEAHAALGDLFNERRLGQLLIERGWMTEAQLTQTRSLQLTVPWVSLYHIDITAALLSRVAYEIADKHCLIPIFIRHVKGQGETLYVAMDDPTNREALAEVSVHARLPARPMIASGSDIRSAIRVYYGNLSGAEPPMIAEEAIPSTRLEAPVRREPPPPPAMVPPVPLPPAPPSSSQEIDDAESPPVTTRSSPPVSARAAVLAAASSEREAPAVPRAEGSEPRRLRGKMLSLTLLDGTTVQLPKAKGAKGPETLTARDFVSALRATAHGADATEILGEQQRWEPVVAALLSILLRKGLIADWEFIDELRKI